MQSYFICKPFSLIMIYPWSLAGDTALGEFKDSITYNLAYALFHSSQYKPAEELLDKIENEQISSSDVSLLFNSRKLLGHINLIRGNYVKALEFYEKAIDNEKNVISRFEVFCNLTLLCSQAASIQKLKNIFPSLME